MTTLCYSHSKRCSRNIATPSHQWSASGVSATWPDCTVSDSGASKFMDAMPFCIFLQMNDQQYKSGVWNHLGLSVGPVNPGSLRCQCGTLMSDPDHPHTCVLLSGARIGRHDICENAWYRGMQSAGMSVSKQPKNRHLQMQDSSPIPGSEGYGNRGDLLGVSLTRMVELYVTFVHTTGSAGRTQGVHKEVSGFVKTPRESTMRRRGHRGTPMQLLRMIPTDDWGTWPRNRLGS